MPPTASPGPACLTRLMESFPRPCSCPSARRAPSKASPRRWCATPERSILLGNTYHLALRPGDELVADLGGLHRSWAGTGRSSPTPAGSRCSASPASAKITDRGAKFKSHIDGSPLELTPERAVEIQQNLGSDIAMVLDECPPADADAGEPSGRPCERSVRWADAVQGPPHPRGPGAVRHRPGRPRPLAAGGLRGGTGGDGLPRLRARRVQRRRGPGGDARRPAGVRRLAAGSQAAVPDGRRPAGGPARRRSRRGSTCSTA